MARPCRTTCGIGTTLPRRSPRQENPGELGHGGGTDGDGIDGRDGDGAMADGAMADGATADGATAGGARGFLLTRGWRDTPAGIELSLWAATAEGPLRIVVGGQEAVCFVERGVEVALPPEARRRELPLALLGGEPVDALYFRRHRELQAIRHGAVRLCESDVKPVDRFLMERFVRAGFEASGTIVHEGGHRVMHDPVLRPADLVPRLDVVSLDIETRGGTNELYSIAAARLHRDTAASGEDEAHGAEEAVVFMVGTGASERRAGYTLHYRAGEREVLTSFVDWLQARDPDVLSGWSVVNFDLDFLERRCLALGVPFRIGRGAELATVLQPSASGAPRVARVPGRAVLDGIELIKATFRTFESYALDNVAHELLGTGKLIGAEQDKLGEINRLFRDDKPRLADYNLRDCTLVNEILAHAALVEFAVRRASLTGLALDRFGGAAAAFDNLYLPQLHRRGHVAPDVDRRENASGGPGGHVMDSEPGFHEDVLVLDFKSLYPSIIRTFFVDPLAHGASAHEDPEAAVPGLPRCPLLAPGGAHPARASPTTLWAGARRGQGFRTMRRCPTAVKIIMNSFYGVLGTRRLPLLRPAAGHQHHPSRSRASSSSTRERGGGGRAPGDLRRHRFAVRAARAGRRVRGQVGRRLDRWIGRRSGRHGGRRCRWPAARLAASDRCAELVATR